MHNEELHNLYSSPNIITMMKSRRMRCAEHALMREKSHTYRILVGKPECKWPVGRQDISWLIILRCILEK
jgi:hypothetical protein